VTKNQFLTEANKYLERIEGNFKESTFKEKQRKLRFYAETIYELHQQGIVSTCNPRKFTPEDFYQYQMYRMKTVEGSTFHKDYSILNGFFEYLGNNVVKQYKAIYGNKKPPAYGGRINPLSDKAIGKVLKLARETDEWDILEGCVAIILGFTAGIRPQEVRMLHAEDVVYTGDRPYVFVRHPKGEDQWGRQRKAPISDDIADILDKFFKMREKKVIQWKVTSPALFPPLMKKVGFLTMESIDKPKRKVSKIIGEDFVLKDARRAYGQRMLDKGVPIESVSYAMGHDSIETTQKYYANYREKAVLDNIYGVIKGKPDGMP